MKKCMRFTALIVSVLMLSGVAHAGSDKKASREREMLRRVQQQLQQTQGQLGTLESERAQLSADLEKASKDGEALRGRASRLGRELKAETQKRSQLEQELAALNQRLADTDRQLRETGARLGETMQTLRQAEADRHSLENTRLRQEREIALCEDKNGKLYQLGRELMTRYENKGLGETLLQREPLTGLKQVSIENLLEEYRDRLDDQQIIKAPGS